MSTTINFQELREKLEPSEIKAILETFDIRPSFETEKFIIFPTCCHNLVGGSHKLYYYKNTRLFKCYTQCDEMFDIFQLLIKMMKLRDVDYSIFDAITRCGVSPDSFLRQQEESGLDEDITFLYNLLYTDIFRQPTTRRNAMALNRYVFDETVLSIWEKEGISFETMHKYGIAYDPIENCIVIPNYDDEGNLVGIRGRFLSEDADAKYKPLVYCGEVMSHPTSSTLFGLNQTKDAIRRNKSVFIFESEKSVMMMDSIYGSKNCSVATLGKSISIQQIELLQKYGVREVILCYDADYHDYATMVQKRKEYFELCRGLKMYFNTCVVMDLNCELLGYKDSPIDRGKEIFERLLKNRLYM